MNLLLHLCFLRGTIRVTMPASENLLQDESPSSSLYRPRKLWHRASAVHIFDNYNANLHTGEFNGVMNGKMDRSFPKPHSRLNSGSYHVYTFQSHPQL